MSREPKSLPSRASIFANAATALKLEMLGIRDEWSEETLKIAFDLSGWSNEEMRELLELFETLSNEAALQNEIRRRLVAGNGLFVSENPRTGDPIFKPEE